MFPESFAFQLIVFLLGQVAAWCYLRTGRVGRGVALMIGGWVLADTALLARIAFDDARGLYLVSLIGLQIYSLAELCLFCYGWWRHRRRLRDEGKREEHRAAFTEGFRAYLSDDLEGAESAFRDLVQKDPWDLQSSLALATVAARGGRERVARRWFRAARALDREVAFGDVIDAETARWEPAPPAVAETEVHVTETEPAAPVTKPSKAKAREQGLPVERRSTEPEKASAPKTDSARPEPKKPEPKQGGTPKAESKKAAPPKADSAAATSSGAATDSGASGSEKPDTGKSATGRTTKVGGRPRSATKARAKRGGQKGKERGAAE